MTWWLLFSQHWSETESTKVCYSSQHNESKVETHKKIHTGGVECGNQIWFGDSWSHRTSQEKSRGYGFICGWADWQTKKWG